MPVYKLRNGLSIDLTFDTPTVLTPRPAKLEFKPMDVLHSYLDAYPFPIDRNGDPIPYSHVLKMTARGELRGASKDVFNRCSLRFIQVIKVQSFSVEYFGKQKEEGFVSWRWTNQLLLRNIDCWVSEDGSQDSSPFQFYPINAAHADPSTLSDMLKDTPGANIPLAEFNKASQRTNYLRTFNDRRNFESIVTFVHPDGSTEMLESWKWGFSRSVALKWVKLSPEFDGTNQITFTAANSSASLFGKDDDYADTMLSGRIANRLTREAMNNIQTSPNVSYHALADPDFLWPDTFWSP